MDGKFGLQAGAEAVAQEGGVVAGIGRSGRRAAAEHGGVDAAGVEQAAVEVFRPFPNQAVHVVDAPVVGFQTAYFAQTVAAALGVSVEDGVAVGFFVGAVGFEFGCLPGKFPLVDGGQVFALGGAVGVGGEPGNEDDGFVQVGFLRGVAVCGFDPMGEVVAVALFAAEFAALPLGIFFNEFVELGIGNGQFVHFKGADFGQRGVGGKIEGAVGAAGQVGHFTCRRECGQEGGQAAKYGFFHVALSSGGLSGL